MGAEGAVNIIGRSAIEASDDPEETREEMLEEVKQSIDPYIAAKNALIDDIIDPRETRPTIVRGAADGEGQAGRAAVAQARGDAGMSVAEKVADATAARAGTASARSRHARGRAGDLGASGDVRSTGSGDKHVRLPAQGGADAGLGRQSPTASVYFRSEKRVGKIKRSAPTPRVLVAPCDSRGKPLRRGDRGTRPDPPRSTRNRPAEAAIQSNFGLGRRMYEGVAMNLGPEQRGHVEHRAPLRPRRHCA